MDLHEEAERLANNLHVTDNLGKASDTLRALSTRLAEVERERDEARNQLDSARHSVEVLEKRAAQFMAELDEARARVAALEDALHMIETEISTAETYNPRIEAIARAALDQDKEQET